MAYRNIWGGSLITAFPDYTDDGEAIWVDVDNFPEVDGENFRGTSVIGGDFIYGESIPSEYQNHYLLADYMGWIKAVEVDDNDEIVRIEHWIDSIGRPVDITFNPYDGCAYITSLWPTFIERICFGGNLRPVVKLAEDTLYGQSPLEVTLDASESFDPEGGPLEFLWEFGDGSTGTGQTVSHTYSGSGTISHSHDYRYRHGRSF
jgi:PKD repeat protein